MPNPLDDVSDFTSPVTSPTNGEVADQGTFAAGLQALANRTRYLLDHLSGVATLAVNTVLGRRSAGATGGQPTTDFSFDLLALGSSVAHADALHVRGTAIASGSTTNIAGATGTFVHVTGSTTINAFGTAGAGSTRIITFDSPLTINHSPTAIILPGGLPLSVLGGESVLVVSEGAGIWRVIAARSGGIYADTIHRFLDPAAGNDANDGLTDATPFRTFARCNTELARYALLANFVLHGVGSGGAIDARLNAPTVGRVIVIGRGFTVIESGLELAAGTTTLHLRLTASPAEANEDKICRVMSGAAEGQMRLVQGWRTRRAARFAATSNLTLNGVQTPDGTDPTEDGDLVLAYSQTAPLERLIYIARDSGDWDVAKDFRTASQRESASVLIEEGDTNAGVTFYQLAHDVGPLSSDPPEWSTDPLAIELSYPLSTAPSAGDVVEILEPEFTLDTTAIFESPGAAIACPGAVWFANVRATGFGLIAITANVAKWACFGEIYACTSDFLSFPPETSGEQLHESAVFGEAWLSSPDIVLGCGTVCFFPTYKATGNYHTSTLDTQYTEDSAVMMTSGVIRGFEGVGISARYGAITVAVAANTQAIPIFGVINHRSGRFRASALSTTLGLVWCGDISAALVQSHSGDCAISGGHAGYTTGYALDAEPGGSIALNAGNYPGDLLGEKGDAHVGSITVPHAVLYGANRGIGDFRAPYATGGCIFTSSVSNDTPVDSYAPTSSGTTVTLEPSTRAMMIDNRADDVVVEMADPTITLEACDLVILGSTDDHPVTLRPMHGEEINHTAGDFAVVASPYSALRVHCDRTQYFVSGNRVLTS